MFLFCFLSSLFCAHHTVSLPLRHEFVIINMSDRFKDWCCKLKHAGEVLENNKKYFRHFCAL